MTNPQPIHDPWIIVHELGNKMQTILAGPPDATYEKFSILVADIIGHIARAYDVDEQDVLRWVERELNNPTSDLTGGKPS